MLNLVIGRSGTGKSTLLLRRACQHTDCQTILLVPDPHSHEAERRLCKHGGDRACLHAEVLTFSRLANRIFQTAGGLGRSELDQGGRLLLMSRAVQAVSGQLSIYAKPSRRPAFLSGLLDTADELKSCCISPDRLSSAGEEIGGITGSKLKDLALICATYDAMTAQTALDPRDRLTQATEKLAKCRWAEGKHFYLDGFVDFTPQQLALIDLLLEQGESVTVALTCDHLEETEDGTGIFSPARRTAMQLQRLAAARKQPCTVEVCRTTSPTRSPAITALEQRLFHTQEGESTSCGDDIRLFCAPAPRTEVEWTASTILSLVRKEGLRFRDIGVTARGYGRYDALVESVFDHCGIPVFRSAMSDILQKPVLSLVVAALDAVSGGYTYDDMFRYLKTDLTNLTRDERDLLENYVLKWDLHGSRWTQEAPWTMHPRGYGFPLEEEDRLLLEQVDALRRKVSTPLERLRTSRDQTGRGRAMALYALLEEIGIQQQLEARTDLLRQQGQLGLAEEYRQLWDILCNGLEQCALLLGSNLVEPDEFTALFKLVLSQYSVGTIPVSLDRVTAGELGRQSGHGIKVLFLLGADDSALPAVHSSTGLLSDDDREQLSAYGVDLGLRGIDRLYREMTDIYMACTRPDQKLLVSFSLRGNGGEELRPSFLVERLRHIFPDLTTLDGTDGLFRLCAPRPALEQAGTIPQVRSALASLPQWAAHIKRLDHSRNWQRGTLSRQSVDRLYGKQVPMSASRMDKYKACHFSYFMQYGLRAQPRRTAGFDAPEYGTFVHYVLEHVLRDGGWQSKSGEVDEHKLKQLTHRIISTYVQEELGGLEHQTARFRYLFHRLLSGVDQVVDNVVQELAASSFRPISFELGFGRNKDLPPVELEENGIKLSITGFVDRVDGWVHEDKLYLRVVDYKTGSKSFDLTEVANGMGLQMLLYLFTLRQKGLALYGKEIVPSGVLYIPARTAIVPGSHSMTEAEQRKLVDKQLRRKGLVLDDPEVLEAMESPDERGIRFLPIKRNKNGSISGDALVSATRFARLERHVERVLRDICTELASGNIAADPFWRGPEKNACQFCDYAAACHFEEGRGGDCRRRMHTTKAADFWQSMEENNPLEVEVSANDGHD